MADPVARFGQDRKPYWTNPAWVRRFGNTVPAFLGAWDPDGPQEGVTDGVRWTVLAGAVALVLPGQSEEEPVRYGLGPEESTLARWASEGLSNKDIALRLGLSEGTVKNKMSQVLAKVGAKNRSELRRRLG